MMARNCGTSSGSISNCVTATMGPLRSFRSSCSAGSLNRSSGERSRSLYSGSGILSPTSAATASRQAAPPSATPRPQPSETEPQTQLPAAMPPKLADW